MQAAAKAGERVLHNIEKWNAANPADPEAPAMDLMLVTQVLQATGLEFGRGVEGLTLGLQKTVKQANAAIQTLGSLEKWKEVRRLLTEHKAVTTAQPVYLRSRKQSSQ